jgi:hypothetical protein
MPHDPAVAAFNVCNMTATTDNGRKNSIVIEVFDPETEPNPLVLIELDSGS